MTGGYDGPVHFDYKPPRTEDDEGVWVSAAACMRNYLILRDKVRAFRADPEVKAALAAVRGGGAGHPHPRRGRDLAGRPRASPPTSRRWAPAAWPTSTSTSSPSSTSTASGNSPNPGRGQAGARPAVASGVSP